MWLSEAQRPLFSLSASQAPKLEMLPQSPTVVDAHAQPLQGALQPRVSRLVWTLLTAEE